MQWVTFWSDEIDPDARHRIRELCLNLGGVSSHTTKEIGAEFQVLILDANGEIYLTSYDMRDKFSADWGFSSGGWRCWADHVGAEEGWQTIGLKRQEISEDETIPDTVQGVYTVIFAVVSVYDQEIYLDDVVPDDISIEYIYG